MLTSPQQATRHIASTLTAVGIITFTVAACGASDQSKPPSSSAAQEPSSSGATAAAPASKYDISKVDSVKDAMPPGFKPDPRPEIILNQGDIDNPKIIPFTKAKFDPPQCRALVIPPYIDPTVGARAAGLSAEGDQGEIFVVAMNLPKPIPATPLPAGCDHVGLSGSPEATGSAESIPGPRIDGVTTTGVKLTPSDDNAPSEYIFTAELGDQTSIAIMGGTVDELNPQQVLSDLLVKATNAVRG
ncbi:hypothetical protein GCM10009641_64280 [Mycobacterium cookii]|uniref:DUF5642 domain-containing protein n=1 Tax=Mycobacterium cookii TaxID=1775 RepID=A0A7I7KWW4_9MYCO|nr:DUF5642 family protein [Mycobacterium cookii]MCV7328543.1 DUF5642 family protein [Mycobacterium cookii]BBX45842.1 hypothetical protein MCOO_18570 [Mycobacterium cookii]